VGLIGVFIVSVVLGLSLAFYTAIGRGIIHGGENLLYPLVPFGIYRGLRIDGLVLADLFAPLVIIAVLLVIIAALKPGRLSAA
jgi:hypothetical protein